MNRALILIALMLVPQIAEAFSEPAKGSAERRALMDALRPLAEAKLGAPVEFVVQELRVEGRAAYAMVAPQRPGGGQIDLYATPMVQREGMDPAYMDGANMQALLLKEGNTWVAVDWRIGATDAWWADPANCRNWGAVLPELC
ncbi:hypothetical protein SAMN04488103_10426 [Gemmobacter aquatilis]|uniref:Uncharacterized protein n=1 Tax=Gemmobacter aquatilis TaxID=933059 RepID=A0A1H8F072_9RHOB|nr:hypothetical protein [Gemmobacter aquatilis]SEN25036.1 hypothetical protein SAMN04488103_10426 [Gemmobacter aquatilis]